MTQEENKTNYKEWFDIGKRDLEDAELLLGEGRLENAAILLQQALEKYFKGFLVSKGWELKKTHNLSLLLIDALKHLPRLKKFENICKKAWEVPFGYLFIDLTQREGEEICSKCVYFLILILQAH